MKLALGTVQFGLAYGIANVTGRVSREEGVGILALAAEHGIDMLDTAIAYGESEATLGRMGVGQWRIVTKLPSLPDDCMDVGQWVQDQMAGSLERLKVHRVHALLLHRPEQLLGPQGPALLEALKGIKAAGQAAKVGVSIYSPDELGPLFDLHPFELVQAPMNILDQRLVTSGWAARLSSAGVEIHTRSAFLQGLLLMPLDQVPERFKRWEPVFRTWSDWLHGQGLDALSACLRYALSVPEVDRVVVGVDSVRQLAEILKAATGCLDDLPRWPRPIDPELLNPACWSQL